MNSSNKSPQHIKQLKSLCRINYKIMFFIALMLNSSFSLSINAKANNNNTNTNTNTNAKSTQAISVQTMPEKAQTMSDKAAKQTAHFGKLVGQWEIKDQSLAKDGKWQNGPGANWNFYWILGGNAIQDDWIAPGYKTPEPEKGRQFGTNIRIFNPKTNQWDMAWAANTGKKIDSFKAVSDEKTIVMNGIYGGQATKITFYDINQQRFSWKMEKQNAETKKWLTVYKIEAYKVKD